MALRKFTEDQCKEAKRLHAEGLSFAEIGRQMGVIEQAARYLALRKEIPETGADKKPAEEKVEYFRHDRYYM